ncbi:MAG: hypothetical protein ACKVXR_15775 [Planctomycetota bacterium]
MRSSHVAIAGLLSILSGCASIVSKSSWPVNVTATPADAEVEIVNESGSVIHKAKAPFTVTLKSGKGYFDGEKYTLRGTAAGYSDGTSILDTDMNGWYIGNLLFGGLIGFLIVDPLTGAMYKLPESAHVALTQTQP